MNYVYIHNHSPVLDWTVQSGLTISGTGPDCGPKEPDRTVRSFYQSPFSSLRPDRFSQTGPYFLVRTAVPVLRTVQSGLLERSPKMATVQTGPDHGQSKHNVVHSTQRVEGLAQSYSGRVECSIWLRKMDSERSF